MNPVTFLRKAKSRIFVTGRRFYIYTKCSIQKAGKRKNVLSHVTYYSVGNVGDTVLSACVRKTFDDKAPFFWNLISVNRTVDQNLIANINTTNGLLIGGGGLFLPDTNENAVSGWQWACSQEMLNEISVPIIVYSVGYNYFPGQKPSPLFIDNLNALLAKAEFFGLRNWGSVEAVKKLSRPELADKIVYQPCTTTLIRKLYPSLPPKQQTKKVAFNLAFDRIEARLGKNKDQILSQIAKGMKEIEKKGYELYFIAHVTKDLEFLPYLKAAGVTAKVKSASSWSTKQLISFYNQMDFVAGMRGHAQMIPFGVNCHILTLGSHDKMRWFLEDINALDWYIDITKDPEHLCQEIVEKFEEIHEKHWEETTKRLLEAQDKLYQITQENMKQIEKLFHA